MRAVVDFGVVSRCACNLLPILPVSRASPLRNELNVLLLILFTLLKHMFFIDRCPESLQLLEYSHPKLDGHFLLRAIYRAAMLAMLTSTTRRSLPEATVSTKCLTGTSTWIVGLRTSKQKHGYREALARRNGPVSFRTVADCVF